MDILSKERVIEVGSAYIAEDNRRKKVIADTLFNIAMDALRKAGFDKALCPNLKFDRNYQGVIQFNYIPVDRRSGLSNQIYSAPITGRNDMRVEILLGENHQVLLYKEILTSLYLRKRTLFSKIFGSFFDRKIRINHIGDILKYL